MRKSETLVQVQFKLRYTAANTATSPHPTNTNKFYSHCNSHNVYYYYWIFTTYIPTFAQWQHGRPRPRVVCIQGARAAAARLPRPCFSRTHTPHSPSLPTPRSLPCRPPVRRLQPAARPPRIASSAPTAARPPAKPAARTGTRVRLRVRPLL